MVKVKICGITNPEQAKMACDAGADAIGLVFYDKSPRYVSLEVAKAIASVLPPFITTVGLFVNASNAFVGNIIKETSLDLLQFHGDEVNAECAVFERPFIKALRMKPDIQLEDTMAQFPDARGFLLDAFHPEKPGGTGEQFNWERFPRNVSKPLILAGGLNVDNIEQAISVCSPYAVDVSGGVESQPGIKSPEKVTAFIKRSQQVSL